jgi:hypothetical protein
MKLSRIFIVLCFIPFLLNAQSIKRLVKNGDKAFDEQDYYTASEFYQQAYEQSPKEEAIYKWALSEYHKRDYQTSLDLFQKLETNKTNKYPLCTFYIAMNLKSLGKYQKANKYFHKFYKSNRQKHNYYTTKAKHEILSTEKAFDMYLTKDSIELKLEDTLSEARYSELLFRDIAKNKSYLIAKKPINEQDTFFSSRLFAITPDSSFVLDSNLNRPYFSINGFCFTNRQDEMLISACSMINEKKVCLIYKTKLENEKWTSPKALPVEVNLQDADNIHPYFFTFKNKDYLLFASNSKKGKGGFDLYYSLYKNGKFKAARNLGKRINSIDNEISPYYDTLEQKLFFSSEWFFNNGGYDIFYSTGNFPNVSIPENMGQPINSNYDDLFYSHSYNAEIAYLSSNRLNGALSKTESCCNDIFSYRLKESPTDTLKDSLIVAKKIDEMEQLIPINLYFDNDCPNPKTRDTTTLLSYEDTYNKYFMRLKEYENKFSAGLKKEEKEKSIKLIDEFFYGKVEKGFDKLKEFNRLMLKLLTEGYDIRLTVKGFASPLNSNDYNIFLSKRRVNSIVNYYKRVEDGIYNPFINGTSDKGKLIITEEAFGENTAAKAISDDRKDTRNSIYSPWAAEERRVQLVAFKLGKKTDK